jgi:hypothetical protein
MDLVSTGGGRTESFNTSNSTESLTSALNLAARTRARCSGTPRAVSCRRTRPRSAGGDDVLGDARRRTDCDARVVDHRGRVNLPRESRSVRRRDLRGDHGARRCRFAGEPLCLASVGWRSLWVGTRLIVLLDQRLTTGTSRFFTRFLPTG